MPPKKTVQKTVEKPAEKSPENTRAKRVSCNPGEYQHDLSALRENIKLQRTGYIDVQLRVPYLPKEVHLQLKCTNVYIIGFHGKDGWYDLDGEEGGWGKGSCGKGSCGVGGNYNDLGDVDKITVSSVKKLAALAEFKSRDTLTKELIVIAAAVVSEALRFEEVANLFTELFGVQPAKKQVVLVGELRGRLFVNWDKLSQANDKGVLLKKL